MPARRSPYPATLALGIGLFSLGLLPFVPVLPGLGSLLALTLGLLACRRLPTQKRWLAVGAMAAGGIGALLALSQLLTALLAVFVSVK